MHIHLQQRLLSKKEVYVAPVKHIGVQGCAFFGLRASLELKLLYIGFQTNILLFYPDAESVEWIDNGKQKVSV
jgi:hypothetical protein